MQLAPVEMKSPLAYVLPPDTSITAHRYTAPVLDAYFAITKYTYP
ncbi:hypothetical protein K2D_11020 [Planctomycetes bacterium K2D]|nr:hypothetical protein K2D_11020 [Planctomycetes bacterium K2D]